MNVFLALALFYGAVLVCVGLLVAGNTRLGSSYGAVAASAVFVFVILLCIKARSTQSKARRNRDSTTGGHPQVKREKKDVKETRSSMPKDDVTFPDHAQQPTDQESHDEDVLSNYSNTPSERLNFLLAKIESVHPLASSAIPLVETRQDLHDRADVQLTDPVFLAMHRTDPSNTTYPDSGESQFGPNLGVNNVPITF